MRCVREKRDVYLNVAKAPSFLVAGDPERCRLRIAMATCYGEGDLLCSAPAVAATAHAGAGGAARASAKAGGHEADLALELRRGKQVA